MPNEHQHILSLSRVYPNTPKVLPVPHPTSQHLLDMPRREDVQNAQASVMSLYT